MRRYLIGLVLCLVGMAVSACATTVTSVGSGDCNNNTCSATIAGGIAAGQGIIVEIIGGWTTANISGCTDSATGGANTYTVDAEIYNADSYANGLCSAYATRAIAVNGTVTVNLSNTHSYHIIVFDASSFASSSWAQCPSVCKTTANTFVSTITSGTTSGSLSATSIVFGGFSYAGTFSAYGGGYTGLNSGTQAGSSGRYGAAEWKEASSGTQVATITQTANNDGNGVVVAYLEGSTPSGHCGACDLSFLPKDEQ